MHCAGWDDRAVPLPLVPAVTHASHGFWEAASLPFHSNTSEYLLTTCRVRCLCTSCKFRDKADTVQLVSKTAAREYSGHAGRSPPCARAPTG